MHGEKHREIQREGAGLKTREPNEEYKCRIISGERDEVKNGTAPQVNNLPASDAGKKKKAYNSLYVIPYIFTPLII